MKNLTKPVRCANAGQGKSKTANHSNRFQKLKADFIRLAAWLSIAAGAIC